MSMAAFNPSADDIPESAQLSIRSNIPTQPQPKLEADPYASLIERTRQSMSHPTRLPSGSVTSKTKQRKASSKAPRASTYHAPPLQTPTKQMQPNDKSDR